MEPKRSLHQVIKVHSQALVEPSLADGVGEGGSEGDFDGIGGVEIIKAESGQTHGISKTLTA